MPLQNGYEFHRQITIRALRDASADLNDLAFTLMEYPEHARVEALIEIQGMMRCLRVGLRNLEDKDG
jgi:hypothetical protein